MIQDIFPHVLKNQYDVNAVATTNDVVLNIVNGKLLVDVEKLKLDRLTFPKVKDFVNHQNYVFTYLFSVDEVKYFLLTEELSECERPDGFDYIEERETRTLNMAPLEQIFAATTGKHLADWYRDTRFCGRCGCKMEHSKKERAMACPSCGYTAYPRIMPAVIVGVINEDKLLITRYKTGFKHNALIAGFTEIGETAEETVAREVMEEAGVKVKNIRYYKSQPWGSANDLLLGYFCDLDGDDTIEMDGNELKFAQWLSPDEIELQPGNYSLTNEMMRLFKEGHKV